jgi:hypothetical protein
MPFCGSHHDTAPLPRQRFLALGPSPDRRPPSGKGPTAPFSRPLVIPPPTATPPQARARTQTRAPVGGRERRSSVGRRRADAVMICKCRSCTPKSRNIRLNTDLAKKPHDCLEYILVHEMVHLLEPSHNARFVSLMDSFVPKWQFYRDELNRLPVRHEHWDY